MTIAFPAMALMFAMGGSLMAASIDRYGIRSVGRRMRRILPPLWTIAAVFVPVMLATGLVFDWRMLFWVLPVYDPPATGWGALALSVIWYLRDYLWFALVSPLLLPLFRRFPLPTVLAPFAALSIVEIAVPAPKLVPHICLYLGFWLLGFAHHDGLLQRLGKRVIVPLAGTVAVLGAAWFLTHPGPRGYDLNDILLGDALWSAAFVLPILAFAPTSIPWLAQRAGLSSAVTLLNRRALTIYLWHQPAVVAIAAGTSAIGLGGLAGLPVRLVTVAVLVVLAVAIFGWVEDVAARRRPIAVRRPTPSPAKVPSARANRDVAAVGAQMQHVHAGRNGSDVDVYLAVAGLRVDLVVPGWYR
jgi:peptidoglycan/LPS O-acetylase OafA/YrhL